MESSSFNFQLAFWHPFGPHGRESQTEIIDRKKREIKANGWTLWSFQYRRMLDPWYQELSATKPAALWVFCSGGRGAVDPPHDPICCKRYQFVGPYTNWDRMPDEIKVPHPFRPGKNLASAFIVQDVVSPLPSFVPRAVEWYSRKSQWRQDRIPTRNEYLIRPGGEVKMRTPIAALLLKPPYLARVAKD
jgi:hypothetical protein